METNKQTSFITNMNNIETGFKKLKLFLILFFASSTVVTVYAIYSSYAYAQKQNEKIYVLDQGKSLVLALQSDRVANKAIEAKDHINRFHELFFTLSPSANAIKYNIGKALQLANKNVYTYYKDLQESGYLNRIISSSISQNIEIDSISLDMNVYPYKAVTYARQYILRESVITEKNLVTRCDLVDISRSDDNPHGLMIEKFEVVNNDQIRQLNR